MMQSMTNYDFGDVLLVPFPFTDQTDIKKRPAVVVSSSVCNRKRPDLVVMAVTSQIRSTVHWGDTTVLDWKQAGLVKPSVIKPIIATVGKRLIFRRLGHLGQEDRKTLQETLRRIIGV